MTFHNKFGRTWRINNSYKLLKKRQVMDVWLQILWQKRYIQKAQESLSIVWKRMKPLMLLMEKY